MAAATSWARAVAQPGGGTSLPTAATGAGDDGADAVDRAADPVDAVTACTGNLMAGLRTAIVAMLATEATERAINRGSAHPLASQPSLYQVGVIHVPDATVLWVSFDERCETDATDETAFLALFAEDRDAARATTTGAVMPGAVHNCNSLSGMVTGSCIAHFSGPPNMFKPLMVRANTLTYVVSKGQKAAKKAPGAAGAAAAASAAASESGWGVQFTVIPLSAMVWGRESDAMLPALPQSMLQTLAAQTVTVTGGGARDGLATALATMPLQATVAAANVVTPVTGAAARSVSRPSLLWGCWLLETLLSGALPHSLLARGVVHNARLVTLCFDYLRTTSAPFKHIVTALLHRLLSSTEYTVITPHHCDYDAAGTATSVVAATTRYRSALPAVGSADEVDLLQRLTIVPMRTVEMLRVMLYAKLAEANQDAKAGKKRSTLFSPQPLQRLIELAGVAEAALMRARLQLRLIHTTNGALYASGSTLVGPAVSPLLTPLPLSLPPDAKQLLAMSVRCDAVVPVAPFYAARPSDAGAAGAGSRLVALPSTYPPAATWSPQLIVALPPPIADMVVTQAMLNLRDITVAMLTHRRIPDAWMSLAYVMSRTARAASTITPNELATMLPTEKLAWAHWANGRFEVNGPARDAGAAAGAGAADAGVAGGAVDEAICAWLSRCARMTSAASALEVSPHDILLSEADTSAFPILTSWPIEDLRLRAAVLLIVNRLLVRALPYLDTGDWTSSIVSRDNTLDAASAGGSSVRGGAVSSLIPSTHSLHALSLGGMLRRLAPCILVDAKEGLITKAIDASETPGPCSLKLSLDNRAALASEEVGLVEPAQSLCTFSQFYRYLVESRVADKYLRHRLSDKEYLFEVSYVGLMGSNEDGLDWGGLYRDSLVRMMEDLFNADGPALDLFTPSPNAIAARIADDDAAALAMAGGSGGGGGGEGSFLPNVKYSPPGAGTATGLAQLQRILASNPAAAGKLLRGGVTVRAPGSTAMASSMYEVVGKLMGISVRTRACLDFDLAPLAWKLIAEEDARGVSVEDILQVDAALGGFLMQVRNFAPPAAGAAAAASAGAAAGDGASSSSSSSSSSADTSAAAVAARDAAMAAAAADAAFTAKFGSLLFVMPDPSTPNPAWTKFAASAAASGGGDIVPVGTACVAQLQQAPLLPGGSSQVVTYATRHKYVEAAIAAVASRYAPACSAMRRGIACVIPDRALRLCSWRELQRLVCGENDIDLEVLKRNTAFDSKGFYSMSHPTIKYFWQVMETLSPEQKRNFVRFAWGRSKLPRGAWPKNNKGEQVRFKIVPKYNSDGLPLAHTCFFLIELPVYPTLEVAKQRLVTAITYGAGEGFLMA